MKLHTPQGLISQPVHFNLHLYPSPHYIYKCAPAEYEVRQHSSGDIKLLSPAIQRRNIVFAGQKSGSDDLRFVSTKKARKHCRSFISAGQFSDFDDRCDDKNRRDSIARRRDVIITPLIAIGASVLKSAVARADEKSPESVAPANNTAETPAVVAVEKKKEEVINSRIYDASAIGEPMALGKDKTKVWEKLMNARIVYLGEAEQVPIRDDKDLELEIVKNLRKKCVEAERSISLALEAFPCDLQEQLNKFFDGR